MFKKKALKKIFILIIFKTDEFLFSDIFDIVSVPWICLCLPVLFIVPAIKFLTSCLRLLAML